jgi:hypothetical protein
MQPDKNRTPAESSARPLILASVVLIFFLGVDRAPLG